MKLIVGLGNYGDEYKGTKHNLGFQVIDQILNPKLQAPNKFKIANSKLEKLFSAEIAEGKLGNKEVVLVKPHTFMNNSGVSVSKLLNTKYHMPHTDLIVVHDDITVELGKIKISKGSGAGNHNGVQSIIDHVKTKEFIRVRLGIGRGEGMLHEVVLSKFRTDEKGVVEEMVKKAVDACEAIVLDGLEKAMNKFNAL